MENACFHFSRRHKQKNTPTISQQESNYDFKTGKSKGGILTMI